jgi:transcriptional regulator with XRE-family HTH domain
MPRKPPSPKAKGLGAALREERNRAGVTLEQAASAIGLSKQVVSRLEKGQRNIAPDEVAGLLGRYGVTGRKRDQLLNLARTLHDPSWWEQSMPGMTPGIIDPGRLRRSGDPHPQLGTAARPGLAPDLGLCPFVHARRRDLT